MADQKTSYKPLVGIGIVVIIVQVVVGLAIYFGFGSNEARGTFGDMFGAVNTLFSGLAFAGVIYAILLQREELRLQREELKLTRKELARTADAQQETTMLMDEQLSREIEPYITVQQHYQSETGSHYQHQVRLMFINRSNPAFDLALTSNIKGHELFELDQLAKDDDNWQCWFQFTCKPELENQIVTLSFHDIRGSRYEKTITFKKDYSITVSPNTRRKRRHSN